MNKQELLDFFTYLDRRGFLREDLQCNPEHKVETYLRDFFKGDKPTETQYVDLGLPSGTLWATCNVGASKPEEFGDYFAWGETKPKRIYTWSTYKYGTAHNQLTKYCDQSSYGKDGFTDTKTVLDAEDDAATANWGNGWRMPTKDEFIELQTKCTSKWTKQNGVKGCLFTGPNGNKLFFPAAGDSTGGSGRCSYYWSGTFEYGHYPYRAFYLDFNSDYVYWNYHYRYWGQSVRAVKSK